MTHKRRGTLTAASLVLALSFACSDDGRQVEVPRNVRPDLMQLTVAGQATIFDENGTIVEGEPIVIDLGATVPVTAVFLEDDGEVVSPDPADYELRGTNTTASIVMFTRAGSFDGTLAGVSPGTGIVRFELYHTEEQHADWGPRNIPITVQ